MAILDTLIKLFIDHKQCFAGKNDDADDDDDDDDDDYDKIVKLQIGK